MRSPLPCTLIDNAPGSSTIPYMSVGSRGHHHGQHGRCIIGSGEAHAEFSGERDATGFGGIPGSLRRILSGGQHQSWRHIDNAHGARCAQNGLFLDEDDLIGFDMI